MSSSSSLSLIPIGENVLPRFAFDNRTDGHFINTVVDCDGSKGDPASRIASTDQPNSFFRQLAAWMCRAYGSTLLGDTISVVIHRCTEEEVSRVATGWVVASVTDHQGLRDRAIHQSPGDAVTLGITPQPFHSSIPESNSSALPFPAGIRPTTTVNGRPELVRRHHAIRVHAAMGAVSDGTSGPFEHKEGVASDAIPGCVLPASPISARLGTTSSLALRDVVQPSLERDPANLAGSGGSLVAHVADLLNRSVTAMPQAMVTHRAGALCVSKMAAMMTQFYQLSPVGTPIQTEAAT